MLIAPRILRSQGLRLVALFSFLFLLLIAVLIVVVWHINENTATAALIGVIEADIRTIENGFEDEGVEEAIEIVRQRLGTEKYASVDLPGGYIVLEDTRGGKLIGNLDYMQPVVGVTAFPLWRHGAILGKGIYLAPNIYLFVGRDTSGIDGGRRRILWAFARITVTVVALMVMGSVFFSVRYLRRVDAIAKTCNAIVAGSFSHRVPLIGNGDELDRLAVDINAMLDRLATLLENLRQVSSDVAHDLRTPLTHLRQRLEEARMKSATVDEYSTSVQRAIEDTDQLLAIFSALLRISQIESGTRLAAFKVFSLSDLLTRLTEMYRPVAEDLGQVLSQDIAAGVSIRGDSELMMQLFVNLIENALRHTPPGTRVNIGLEVSGNIAIVSVSDNGNGIAPEERDKVFRRFYRVANSRTTPGNGLGLPLVAAIAGLHQGKVELMDNLPGLRVSISVGLATLDEGHA